MLPHFNYQHVVESLGLEAVKISAVQSCHKENETGPSSVAHSRSLSLLHATPKSSVLGAVIWV